MLAFLMDQQIHSAITEGLRRRGIDVLTAFEDGRAEADDDELLERATFLQRVFVSQDQELLRITSEWQRVGRDLPVSHSVFNKISILAGRSSILN